MSNVVEFLLRAKDQVSPVIQGLRSQIEGLGDMEQVQECEFYFHLASKAIRGVYKPVA